MYNGYRVIDANRHVIEPETLWADRLAEPYRQLVTVRWPDIEVRGRLVTRQPTPMAQMNQAAYAKAFGLDPRAGSSAAYHLADMDATGIDVAVLSPTLGLYVTSAPHISAALATAICRAYNDWLAEWCAADVERLKGLAILPLQDPAAAAVELRRAVTELGMVGAVIRPNLFLGRQPHHPDYDVLYGEAESLGVPLVVTQLRGSVLDETGADRFENAFALEACTGPFEMMLAFLFFMGHNVLERFPTLSVGFTGGGAGWLGFWLDRAEEHWGGPFGVDAPSTMPPAHLFRTQGFAALDPWETSAPEVSHECGIQSLVWGSHFPHPESLTSREAGARAVADDAQLTDDQKRSILWGNAARFFGVERAEPALTSAAQS